MNIIRMTKMLTAKGNKAANQVIILDGAREWFRSYNTNIALKENGNVFLEGINRLF